MSFDPKCLEVAEHFLPESASVSLKWTLAQHIQDAVENWISENAACPVCGNEERDRRGLLKCECPDPSTLESRRRIAREMAT